MKTYIQTKSLQQSLGNKMKHTTQPILISKHTHTYLHNVTYIYSPLFTSCLLTHSTPCSLSPVYLSHCAIDATMSITSRCCLYPSTLSPKSSHNHHHGQSPVSLSHCVIYATMSNPNNIHLIVGIPPHQPIPRCCIKKKTKILQSSPSASSPISHMSRTYTRLCGISFFSI